MTRKEKFKTKRIQIRKFQALKKRLVNYFEDEMKKQEGNEVVVSKVNLKWLVDITK